MLMEIARQSVRQQLPEEYEMRLSHEDLGIVQAIEVGLSDRLRDRIQALGAYQDISFSRDEMIQLIGGLDYRWDTAGDDQAYSLNGSILYTLGFDELGEFVGRDE